MSKKRSNTDQNKKTSSSAELEPICITEQEAAQKKVEESESLLQTRIQQLEVVTELGLQALADTDLRKLMDTAVLKLKDVLKVNYTKILELLPGNKKVIIRAGVGWNKTIKIDKSTVGTGKNSQAGFTLLAKEPIIVKNLRTDERFNGPPLLAKHGVVSGMSCIIWGKNNMPWGVLGAHTTQRRDFTQDDITFLQAVSNVLAGAIQRKKDEEALKQSENLMRLITDAIPSFISYIDANERYLFVNKTYEEWFGFTKMHLKGKTLKEIWDKKSYKRSKDLIKMALKGEIVNSESISRKSREIRNIQLKLIPDISINGEVRGVVTLGNDITEYKQAEEALRKSKEYYQTMTDNTPVMTWITRPDGTCTYINKLWYDYTGQADEEGLGLGWMTVVHPADLQMTNALFFEANERQVPFDLEFRLLGRDSNYRWHLNSGLPKFNDQGIFEGFIGALIDIHERKIAEEKLRESEEFSRTLLESSPDRVSALDLHGKILAIHPQIQNIKKTQDVDRYIGHCMSHLWSEEYKEKALTAVEKAQQGEIGHFQGLSSAFIGETKWWDVLVAPVYGLNGKVERLVSVSRDITQLKALEKQKDDFISIASHELKTPVTSIKAYTQVLKNRFQKAKDFASAEMLTKMDGQVTKLTNLITDLLDVTKMDQGQLQFKKDLFDFNDLVWDVVEEIQRTTEKHRFIVKVGQDNTVEGDRERIGQVIINFLTNAIKYSEKADKVIVKSETRDGELILSVQDFGLGLPDEECLRIFEKFYRVANTGYETYPGLGLGLYISEQIIHRHNGKIWVESTNGEGSTFYFTLPLAKN